VDQEQPARGRDRRPPVRQDEIPSGHGCEDPSTRTIILWDSSPGRIQRPFYRWEPAG
jgi:hypothetical protein